MDIFLAVKGSSQKQMLCVAAVFLKMAYGENRAIIPAVEPHGGTMNGALDYRSKSAPITRLSALFIGRNCGDVAIT